MAYIGDNIFDARVTSEKVPNILKIKSKCENHRNIGGSYSWRAGIILKSALLPVGSPSFSHSRSDFLSESVNNKEKAEEACFVTTCLLPGFTAGQMRTFIVKVVLQQCLVGIFLNLNNI